MVAHRRADFDAIEVEAVECMLNECAATARRNAIALAIAGEPITRMRYSIVPIDVIVTQHADQSFTPPNANGKSARLLVSLQCLVDEACGIGYQAYAV